MCLLGEQICGARIHGGAAPRMAEAIWAFPAFIQAAFRPRSRGGRALAPAPPNPSAKNIERFEKLARTPRKRRRLEFCAEWSAASRAF